MSLARTRFDKVLRRDSYNSDANRDARPEIDVRGAPCHARGERGSYLGVRNQEGWRYRALPASAQLPDDAYARNCAACHGPELRGGETGPALFGSTFQEKWAAMPAGELESFTRKMMPPGHPGSLAARDYASAIARIRRANGWPVAPGSDGSGDTKPGHNTEWLNNRGDLGSTSYSPLDQINRDNVKSLRVAWRWRSDNYGPTPEYYYRVTPLMADGVLYTTAGIRRTVVALDATTGETLWMYRMEEGARGTTAPRRSSGRGVSFWRSSNRASRVAFSRFLRDSSWSRSMRTPASRFRRSATRASSI